MFNVVLVEPEIPQNTGNIVRTCAATGCKLHLIRPLGFEVTDKYFDGLMQKFPSSSFYFFTTKARKNYSSVKFKEGDFLVFGKETRGLPEELLIKYPEGCVRIPMLNDTRSLNLSNSVAIAVYEGLRQQSFKGFNCKGELHRLSWD